MIILDTNQLKQVQPPAGALFNMLLAVADHAGHKLALPEVALEEYLARYRHEVEEAHTAARNAIRTYNTRLRTGVIDDIGDLAIAPIMQVVRDELQKIFIVLQTPEWAARESLLREARREAPASSKWESKGEGARDVAIWLTTLDQLRTTKETIYFVSLDKRAFGEGSLLPALTADLAGNQDRFIYCCGAEALLRMLATPYSGKVSKDEIESSPIVRAIVQAAATNSDIFFTIAGGIGLGGQGHVLSMPVIKTFIVTESPRVVSYKLPEQDNAWACASVRWSAAGEIASEFLDLTPTMTAAFRVSFSFSTTLLMELDADGAIDSASVLHAGGVQDFKAEVAE